MLKITKLAAPDRPKESYSYQVVGTGDFPVDMLRYDCAYPADSEAVVAIGANGRIRRAEHGPRTVDLRSYSRPTPARWESFLWKVIE